MISTFRLLVPSFLLFISSSVIPLFVNGGIINAITESRYSGSHSLGSSYKFDPRDGWESVNVTNLPYKYRTLHDSDPDNSESRLARRSSAQKDSVINTIKNLWDGLKGIGSFDSVTITWYTGHDLKNPSCWPNPVWAPTDDSFACALTLEGWTTSPRCFQFLELCRTPQTCVFVRVVDTCAGCAYASKHVDLTRAAFGRLADFDEGVLSVQMRIATEPSLWFEDLWGPKA